MSTETVQSIIITAGSAAVLLVWSYWRVRVWRLMRRVGINHFAWAGGDRRVTISHVLNFACNAQRSRLGSRGGRIHHLELWQ